MTVKLLETAPCGIITLLGKLTTVLLELDSITTAPPTPAGPVRLIVPVPDCPLTRALALTYMLAKAGLLRGDGAVGIGVGLGVGTDGPVGLGVGLGVGTDAPVGLMVKLDEVNETPA